MLKKILVSIIIVLNCSILFAGPKPPTSSGGQVPGGAGSSGPVGGGATGGGAPIDGGLSILLLLGASYAGVTVYKMRKTAEKIA